MATADDDKRSENVHTLRRVSDSLQQQQAANKVRLRRGERGRRRSEGDGKLPVNDRQTEPCTELATQLSSAALFPSLAFPFALQ